MPVFADVTWVDVAQVTAHWFFGWLNTSTKIFYLLLLVFIYVCLCIIFKKAGRKRREALIPIRNTYLMCKIVWKKKRFWIFMTLPIIGILRILLSLIFYAIWSTWGDWEVLTTIKIILNWILGMASMFGEILIMVFSFIICFRLAKKFWKSDWFWVWMLFLTPIFLWILAFWKSEYIGENNE